MPPRRSKIAVDLPAMKTAQDARQERLKQQNIALAEQPGPPAFPTFPREKGLTAHALRARAPALSNDVANDPRYLANQDDSGSELIVPVMREGHVVGTVDVESDKVGAFDGALIAEHQRCAEALAVLWNDARP
jgi:putative methionine-R-sulfoxide reductase with GAF domain